MQPRPRVRSCGGCRAPCRWRTGPRRAPPAAGHGIGRHAIVVDTRHLGIDRHPFGEGVDITDAELARIVGTDIDGTDAAHHVAPQPLELQLTAPQRHPGAEHAQRLRGIGLPEAALRHGHAHHAEVVAATDQRVREVAAGRDDVVLASHMRRVQGRRALHVTQPGPDQLVGPLGLRAAFRRGHHHAALQAAEAVGQQPLHRVAAAHQRVGTAAEGRADRTSGRGGVEVGRAGHADVAEGVLLDPHGVGRHVIAAGAQLAELAAGQAERGAAIPELARAGRGTGVERDAVLQMETGGPAGAQVLGPAHDKATGRVAAADQRLETAATVVAHAAHRGIDDAGQRHTALGGRRGGAGAQRGGRGNPQQGGGECHAEGSSRRSAAHSAVNLAF